MNDPKYFLRLWMGMGTDHNKIIASVVTTFSLHNSLISYQTLTQTNKQKNSDKRMGERILSSQ